MICQICGASSAEVRDWRPNCSKHDGDVCGRCCMECSNHVAWSGIWKCTFITSERRKAEAVRKAKAAERDEIMRISNAYHKERKAKAREWYIKQAQARKRNA